MTPCGPNNNFYSSAGTGMGMVTEAIMVELGEERSPYCYDDTKTTSPSPGYRSREEATVNLVQTLTSLLTSWPRETFSGFMVHFTNRWRVKMKLL